jgi:hypothetical protein
VTALTLFCALAAAGAASPDTGQSLKASKAVLASAGPLAFGPDGILFVGDTAGATLWALDTGDRTPGRGRINVDGLQAKVAAMLGTAPDQVAIADMIVNPVSKKAYLSVSRGRGPEATPVILRVDAAGKIEELPLDDVKHAKVSLANVPAADAKDGRGNSLRQEAITDLHYLDGKVFVAGLSNEEFASKLRVVAYPFASADAGTSVEIYHGNHGQWETRSPVRAFVPYEIAKEKHLLAAYTCTPLVKFPVKDLKPGTKLVGTTIAELGNRNRPLDMVVYRKDGGEFLLMSNSSRGVMKMSTRGLEGYEAIKEPVSGTKGLPYETIADWKGVEQLDKLDDGNALILARSEGGALDLKTIALP